MAATEVKQDKPKHPGGRPERVKYDPKYCTELVEFFNVPLYRKEVKSVGTAYDKNGNVKFERTEYYLFPNTLPTIFRFCEKIGIMTDKFYEWTDHYPEFHGAFTRARELYKDFLVQNGLSKLYDATFTMFVAKNTTDLKDKPPVEELMTYLAALQLASKPKETKQIEAPKPN